MTHWIKNTILDIRRLAGEPFLLLGVVFMFAVLGAFILYPLYCVLRECFVADGRLSLVVFKDVVLKPYNWQPFAHSVTLGFWVAVIGTAIGYLFAYSITRIRMPGAGFFRVVATFPIISPPFVVAMAAILIIGKNGLLTNWLLGAGIDIYGMGFELYGLNGLVLVETLSYFPTAFLLLVGVLNAIDNSLEEAAMDLGASRWRVFCTVTLPLSLPGIAASMLLLFIESLADFGSPMILSGRYNVLPTQAYLLITGALNDLRGGALLALLLLIPSLGAFLFQKYYLENKSYVTVTGKPVGGTIKEVSTPTRLAFLGACLSVTAVIFTLYGMILAGSFTEKWGVSWTFTLDNYVQLFTAGSDYFRYILTSVILSACATPITGVIGMAVAYLVVRKKFIGKGLMEFVSMLTFAVPGTVVGIGYVLAFNQGAWPQTLAWMDAHMVAPLNTALHAVTGAWGPHLGIDATALLIVILFVFRNAPVGIRAGIASMQQIDKAIEEASYDLGASSFTTFRKITLPLVSSAFFTGLAYSFVKCMTAISAVIFLVKGDWNVVTIAILDAVESSEYSQAAALSIVLIAFVLAALGLIQLMVGAMGRKSLAAEK
jgi:iron(III) transport system permease protein